MNNRQNSCTRCLIVRNYLDQIEDDQIRKGIPMTPSDVS